MDEKALEAAARAAYDYNNPHMAGKPTEAWRMYIPSIRDAITAYLEASGAARDGTVTVLPDGSAFSVASFPLPSGHWLYAPQCAEWDAKRDTSADTPIPIVGNDQRALVIAAMRWAIRGATMNGKEKEFDPDALALNAAYALCGPANDLAIDAAIDAARNG